MCCSLHMKMTLLAHHRYPRVCDRCAGSALNLPYSLHQHPPTHSTQGSPRKMTGQGWGLCLGLSDTQRATVRSAVENLQLQGGLLLRGGPPFCVSTRGPKHLANSSSLISAWSESGRIQRLSQMEHMPQDMGHFGGRAGFGPTAAASYSRGPGS